MRFCLVSTQEHWGGGEALLWSIGNELDRLGHSVTWIVRRDGEVGKRVNAVGASLLHATKKRGSNISDWFATRNALRKWRPDVILLNDSHAVPLAGSASLFCARPRPLRLAYKHTVFPLRSPLKYRLLSDHLVCVSQAALETVLRGGMSVGHTAVVRGGCTPVNPDPVARANVRAELGLQPHELLLVSIGSLLPCKGHRELVQAMSSVTKQFPQARAVIAGEGEQRASLKRQINALGLEGSVGLLGYRENPQHLLDAADLVVHPSHAEGLSLVLIQAQMMRKPIVATAVGGAQEVLAAGLDECTSWIAEPQNAQSLAGRVQAALACILETPEDFSARLEANAQRMFDRFTVQSTAGQLANLAADLLRKRVA